MTKIEMLGAISDAQHFIHNLEIEFDDRTYSAQIQRRINTILIKLSRLKRLVQDQVTR